MNFDFSWFLTIPGMLITGGVLLLIIALIVLIVSGKKDKKEKKMESESESLPVNQSANMANVTDVPVSVDNSMSVQPIATIDPNNNMQGVSSVPDMTVNSSMPNMTVPTSMDSAPVVAGPSIMSNDVAVSNMQPIPSNDVLTSNVSTVSPVMPFDNSVTPNVELQQAPINNEVVVPSVPVTPTIDPNLSVPNSAPQVVPNVTDQNVSMPVISAVPSVENTTVAPVSNPTIMPTPEVIQSSTDTVNVAQPVEYNQPVSIYGGASPVVPKINLEPEHHQIYGGADPSENTQSIPVINNVNNDAVVAPNIDVPVSPEVVPSPTIVTPQVEPVQPQIQSIPTINSIPSVPVITPTVDNNVDTI